MALFDKKRKGQNRGNGDGSAEVPEIEVRGEKAILDTPEGEREVELSKTKFA